MASTPEQNRRRVEAMIQNAHRAPQAADVPPPPPKIVPTRHAAPRRPWTRVEISSPKTRFGN